jgi:signal transduction histidine kinase
MARRTLLVTYIATYLLAVAAIIRTLVVFGDDGLWPLVVLMGGYLVLLVAEPLVIRHSRPLTYIYLPVQTAIICTLAYLTPGVDFWASLFAPLVVQVMHSFPRRTGFLITGVFTLIMAVFMILGLGLETALPIILVYTIIYFLLAAFIAIILEAVAARRESERQQAELQNEIEQRAQAEEALRQSEMEKAVAAERNRLARELHDSVTQSLYSLTLLAAAGQRMIQAEELEQIAGNQSRLGEIAQQALQEMRLLVYELRPLALESEGLIGALEQRLESVERRAGIQARVLVKGNLELAPEVEEELYGIAQETLNNALKHARASEVVLSVRVHDASVVLEVTDNGRGFDPATARDAGGLGLISMQERADKICGELTIHSAPGEGTKVTVSVADGGSSHEVPRAPTSFPQRTEASL